MAELYAINLLRRTTDSTHFEVQNVQFSFILGNLRNPNMSIIRKLQCVCM